MKKPLSFSLWMLVFVSFSASAVLAHHAAPNPSEVKFLAPPPDKIEYFGFGFRDSIADSLWLRWIQDADTCQTYANSQKLEAKPVHDDKLFKNPRHKVCDDSWGFKMLDATSKLAPKFEMVYLAGGSTLAVATEDYVGASVIFDRGIKEFPDDWRMLYRASYHFLYDTQDLAHAADLLNRASEHGAPSWLKSLAARIYTRTGQIQLGLSTLENYRTTIDNPLAIAEVDKRIAELKAKLTKEP